MNPKGKHVALSMDDLYMQVQKVMFQKMLLLLGLLNREEHSILIGDVHGFGLFCC